MHHHATWRASRESCCNLPSCAICDFWSSQIEAYEKHPAAFKLHWVQKEGKTAQEALEVQLGRASRAPAPASLFTTPVARVFK